MFLPNEGVHPFASFRHVRAAGFYITRLTMLVEGAREFLHCERSGLNSECRLSLSGSLSECREIQKEQPCARLQASHGRRVGGALLTDSAIPVTPGGHAGSLRMLLPPDGRIKLDIEV